VLLHDRRDEALGVAGKAARHGRIQR